MSYGSKGARALCHTAARVLGPCVIRQQGCYGLVSYGSKGARALCHTAVRVLGPCVIRQQGC